ncbi:hypothetical protein AB4427_05905 [Vibrio artabrorum]|uniref:hypothetical protein n=1 Tax=Vibrio artabrorum TaxID=446374 RepID=UPI00354CE3D4
MVQFFKRWFHHYTLDKAKREMSDSQKVQTGASWDDAICAGLRYSSEQNQKRRRYHKKW